MDCAILCRRDVPFLYHIEQKFMNALGVANNLKNKLYVDHSSILLIYYIYTVYFFTQK